MAKKKKDERVKLDMSFEDAIDKALNTPPPGALGLPDFSNHKLKESAKELSLLQALALRDKIAQRLININIADGDAERRNIRVWAVPVIATQRAFFYLMVRDALHPDNNTILNSLRPMPHDKYAIEVVYDIYKRGSIEEGDITQSLDQFIRDVGDEVRDIL